jgi:hypothetical protein
MALSGCNVDGTLKGLKTSRFTLSGVVLPATAGGTAISSLPSAATCSQPKASLYALNSQGVKTGAALATSDVDSSGKYVMKNLNSLGVTFSGGALVGLYTVEIEGCADPLSRVVTDLNNQDVTYGTSLISWLNQTSLGSTLFASKKTSLSQLYAGLTQPTSISSAYSKLTSDASQSRLFQEIFSESPSALIDVPPRMTALSYVGTAQEGVPQTFSISTTHWHPNYQHAFLWKMGNTAIGTHANISFTPSSNDQGIRTVTVYYGQVDSGGALDLTKPFKSEDFSINISNTVPATAPALGLTSANPTSSVNVTLSMTTGSGLANCSSFSSLALTEDALVPPLLESNYTINCSMAPIQILNFTLSPSQGLKTLRLWARDAAGNVSSTPSSVTVLFDTQAPAITISSPTAGASVTGTFTLAGTCDIACILRMCFGNIFSTRDSHCRRRLKSDFPRSDRCRRKHRHCKHQCN